MALIAQNTFTVHRKPDDGLTPVVYSLDISDKLVSKSNAGVLTPSSVSARAILQVGDKREVIGVDAKIDYKGRNLLLRSSHEKQGGNEYLLYENISPVFDTWGIGDYILSFDICVSKNGRVNVYCNDRTDYRYSFDSFGIYASTEYKRFSQRITITLRNEAILHTSLAFYGTYGTGVIPKVKNVKIERCSLSTNWSPAPEDTQIKLFSGNGQTETAYTSGSNYAIKSTDKLLKWQLMLNDQMLASESTTIVADGGKGDQGVSGALLRPRGEWKPNTQYFNNTQYRDTVIYNKNKWIVKNTHTSGSTFDSAQWEDFNEFINVATQVLLADKAWIDILGAQGIAVGSDAANRWELTNGRIRHTATGLELTADGKIIAPPGGITFKGGKSVEDVIKEQVDSVQVGGKNLLRNSDLFDVKALSDGITSSLEGKLLKVVANEVNGNYVRIEMNDLIEDDLKEGDLITISYWAKSSDSVKKPTIYLKDGMGYYSMSGLMSNTFSQLFITVPFKKANPINMHLGFGAASGTFYFKYFKIEKGNKPTDWSPAPEDMDYLTDAIQGDTVLNGGLVMSNVMAVRNGNDNTEESIVAGMSGLKDDGIFFFADVKNAYRKAINYFKGLSSDKPLFAVSKSGFIIALTGLIGCFRIARDLVTIQDSTGKDKVKFTGESIEKFANSVPTMSGATLGNLLTDYNNTVGSFRQYTGTIETLSYSFNLSADTVFAITAKQNLKMEAEATATETPRVDAESYLRVNYRIEVKNNGAVVIDQLIQTEYLDAVTFDGPSRVNSYRDVALNYAQSQAFTKGTVEVKIYARYDMQLYSYSNPNNTVRSSAYAKVELKTGTANGLFTFVSTTDETIIGSDGLSIRLDSNNQFKLLKKDSILSLIFKGRVSPDSNIPDLICGGEVNQWGSPVNKLGEDSGVARTSTGHYRITLPLYMQGKSNYVVQLTGVNTDNVVTRGGIDTAANCFYVQTWQSPGVFEDAGFGYMVYRAR